MLSNIYIKNFAIIDEIEIDFHKNMSVLTGETGAGKSILIDAINVVLGNKKIKKISRNENLDTEIICQFQISNKKTLELLKEKDLSDNDECIFRRKINTKNISKIYINDKPVTSATAKIIGDCIIDIHGQHENQLILSNDEQRNRLDNFIDINIEMANIRDILLEINNIKKELSASMMSTNEYEEKISLLEFEIKELENEVIDPIDYENLSEEFKKLSNSDLINNKLYECKNLIENDSNVDINTLLSKINKNLEEIKNIDEDSNKILDINIDILDQVKNLSKSIDSYSNSLDNDKERLIFLNEKILLLNNLARKYGVNEKDLVAILNKKIDKLYSYKKNRKNFEDSDKKIKEFLERYHTIAAKISKIRSTKAIILEKNITSELKKLGMSDCQFKIEILSDNKLVSRSGYDKVSFLIKTNKKSSLLPLNVIASGGELSRLSLIIQLETRSNDDCETMIFDEIDTGIGGATSEVLGNHLSELSEKTQVLCVTHLAQIAAKSNHHYLVSKDKNISSTKLTYLDGDMKVNEIARMIGGIKLTDKTLQFAKELIG